MGEGVFHAFDLLPQSLGLAIEGQLVFIGEELGHGLALCHLFPLSCQESHRAPLLGVKGRLLADKDAGGGNFVLSGDLQRIGGDDFFGEVLHHLIAHIDHHQQKQQHGSQGFEKVFSAHMLSKGLLPGRSDAARGEGRQLSWLPHGSTLVWGTMVEMACL